MSAEILPNLSENSVFTAMESYEQDLNVKSQIFEWSERLGILRLQIFVIDKNLSPHQSTFTGLVTRNACYSFL